MTGSAWRSSWQRPDKYHMQTYVEHICDDGELQTQWEEGQ